MITNIIIGLTGLGIVVFFHEAGHFIAAKIFGITVETFSLGWGKKLFSFRKGGTEYCISALPLGGYCQMKGEEVLKQALEKNLDYIDAEDGSLFSVSPWKRMVVFFAGPFMNLLFSIVVLSAIWFNGYTVYSPENRIILASDFSEDFNNLPADNAGLKTGDRIIEISGKTVSNYQDIREKIASSPDTELVLKIERGMQTITLPITPSVNRSTGGGRIGVYPWIDPVVGDVNPDSSAGIAGLEKGDVIFEADSRPVKNQMDFYSLLNSKPGMISVKYKRGGEILSSKLIFTYNDKGVTDPGFAFSIASFRTPDLSVAESFKKGTSESFKTLFLSIKGLKMLFSGIDINQAVSGPIRITYMMGEIAKQGFERSIEYGLISFFQFLSLISIALFFMNLLPIPALDGGQIVFSFCEIIFRKNFKPKAVYRYQIFGFVIIFGLLFFSLFNDIIFLIKS